MILSRHPRAHLVAVASAVPPHGVDRARAVAGLCALFPGEDPGFVRRLVERSGVDERRVVLPVDEIVAGASFTERNDVYQRAALELSLDAARLALERAGIVARKVDAVLDVSCTGIAIPALDVELVPRLGLRPDVRRIPITEAGCAGGALGLGLGAQLAQCGMTTLLVTVELCTLSLCQGDRTRANLVAGALFGDGAAAAVIAPDASGPEVLAVGSHLFEKTRELMGFDVGTHGMRIVLQRELPDVLAERLKGVVEGFLADHGRSLADVGLHLVHPGGRRIMDTYAALFGLAPEELRFSRESLRRFGNLSSASVLTVLEMALADDATVPFGTEALVLGIGPGLSAEMALLAWEG